MSNFRKNIDRFASKRLRVEMPVITQSETSTVNVNESARQFDRIQIPIGLTDHSYTGMRTRVLSNYSGNDKPFAIGISGWYSGGE